MRRAAPALLMLLAGCALGPGIDPEAVTTTAAPAATSSTIAVDPQTRADAVDVATRFYDAVLNRDGAAIAAMGTDPPPTLQEELDTWAGSIGVEDGSFIVLSSRFTETGAEITVRLTLDLIEVGPWSYETSVRLVGSPDWRTVWSQTALHPSLEPGDVLRVDRSWQPRAAIRAADGTPLAGAEAVKVVGVVPSRIADLDTLTLRLAQLAGIDPQAVRDELANPVVQPDWFVPVGTIKTVVFETVRQELEDLPGVLFRDGSARLPFQDDFAAHLIGTVGPITAEQLDALGFPYGPTDEIGQTGLEERYEEQLAGRPRTSIARVNRFGREIEELFVLDGADPEPVSTTIDLEVQAAVEFALRDVTRPAAVVVIESSTGQIRGIASRPLDDPFDRSILGTYPPGSTFKVVTAVGLLGAGLEPTSPVACPASVTVGGLQIRNAGDFELGEVSLAEAFAASCNTTFAEQASIALGTTELDDLASQFGFDREPDLGVAAAISSFPRPADAAEFASAAIGQGRVTASPVHMASVAAAAATGAWRPPTVLAQPTRAEGLALDTSAVDALQGMTRAVVTDGTGTAAAVDGVAVHGKTGSAEFAEGSSATHAWFIGYWDDYSIAVLIERGGGGGTVAAPIARRVIGDLEQ